jgi:hypothetical protein
MLVSYERAVSLVVYRRCFLDGTVVQVFTEGKVGM